MVGSWGRMLSGAIDASGVIPVAQRPGGNAWITLRRSSRYRAGTFPRERERVVRLHRLFSHIIIIIIRASVSQGFLRIQKLIESTISDNIWRLAVSSLDLV
jgi:hypothetical protein